MKDLVTIGKIVKPSGLKGRLKAVSFLASPRILEEQSQVFVGLDQRETTPFTVQSFTVKGNALFLHFREVESIETGECLKGHFLFLPRKALGAPGEDEYYWHDIIGLEVITEGGEKLGVITSIIPTGSNDVYVCQGTEGEILLPALEGFIKKIDVQRGYLVAERPEEM